MSESKGEIQYDEGEEGERRLEEDGEDEERTFIRSQLEEVSH